ncbi:MAG: hypothetical protein M3274_02030 [Actinomycetota bacterium]|nr:hypothetical protein [Actinomycetota bacterium]
MKEKQIPQAWVGQDVILCRVGTESWELVALREVSELGLAYEYKAGEVQGQPVFVPWGSVSWMRPPIPEDLQAAETD